MGRPRAAVLTKTCALSECGKTFETPDTAQGRDKRYCDRQCSNKDTAAARGAGRSRQRYEAPVCPCGKTIEPPAGMEYAHNKKYCSPECRLTYGKKKQRDETKWATYVCETCGEDFERRVASRNQKRFCSNPCAAKHTKKVRHYVIRESDMVLDSGWEMLFAGLMIFLKIPVDRLTREDQAVEWSDGHWYAPDFAVTIDGLQIGIEVKGQEDEYDQAKWKAWRGRYGPLVVLGQVALDDLRSCNPLEARNALYRWATQ